MMRRRRGGGGGGRLGGGKEGIYVCLQKNIGEATTFPPIIVPPHMSRLTASPKLWSLYLWLDGRNRFEYEQILVVVIKSSSDLDLYSFWSNLVMCVDPANTTCQGSAQWGWLLLWLEVSANKETCGFIGRRTIQAVQIERRTEMVWTPNMANIFVSFLCK